MQTRFKTALQKQIHDIDTDRSNMSRDHKNCICSKGSRRRIRVRLATIHYSSINNLFNPNPLKVLHGASSGRYLRRSTNLYYSMQFTRVVPFINTVYSSGLNIEVQGALLQVAALSKRLNWEPLQVETSVQSSVNNDTH